LTPHRTDNEPNVKITADLVSALIHQQFPQWSGYAITPIEPGGWDNRTFRLGRDMLVRLPSNVRYVAQVEKEQRWLPVLAPMLPMPIPFPVAMGRPSIDYPWPWSVYRWLDGEPSTSGNIVGVERFAQDLANFLHALYLIDATEGPAAGEHNFFRGGPVATYDREVRNAVSALGGRLDTVTVIAVWDAALASRWEMPCVWVHGDVAPSNLLVRDGRLAAVIDFGTSGVGDPACDLTIAWTLFSGAGREAFRQVIAMDDATWARARGWALWKALILICNRIGPPTLVSQAESVLSAVLIEHRATLDLM
jgi:aminoglycoside phosphotransferase (APT) family kinase protein